MSTSNVRTINLPSGEAIPVLGQGTWGMGEDARYRKDEVATLRLGIDLGMTLIDTAEMYANGAAESIVAEALVGRRDNVFVVSKVLPSNATRQRTIAACERSLRRLKMDRLDLYLLHWRGQTPLAETIDAFATLVHAGKIRYWGVSNFNVSDIEELVDIPGGAAVTTDQVLYNLTRRGIEYGLLPRCRERRLPIMAYSPIEQGRMLSHPELQRVAAKYGVTAAQVALAWLLRQDGINVIPRARTQAHVQENRAALDLRLTEQDITTLDRAFPPPTGPRPLEML